jgi:hypothetical protein
MTLNQGHWRSFVPLVCAATILFGCHKAERAQQPASSADPKAEIYKFLKKKSGQKQFKSGFNLNLPKDIAVLRSNATALEQRTVALRTSLQTEQKRDLAAKELDEAQRALQSARAEISEKENELSAQENTYIRATREQLTNVRSYEALYRVIGEQLTTADALLEDPDISRRRIGLKLAREACGHANADSEDMWLAARICEAYFWPNLDLADTRAGSREHALDLLETCRRVFFVTYETNNVLKNYALLMSNAPNARAADTFRVQLADWMEERGNIKRASEALSEIRDAEILAANQERITRIKERLASSP